MTSFKSTLITGVEFLYGCLFLTAALGYSCLQKEFWWAQTEEEELALQQG
jgi:hypothetical protein